MPVETERKFLLASDDWQEAVRESRALRQGYLAESENASVRIRTIDDAEAVITVKSRGHGISRPEYEYSIPIEHARELLELCGGAVLEKRRHIVMHDDNRWEIDVYSGSLQGLVVAELELGAEDQHFARPVWLGREVSDDPRYFNSALARQDRPPEP